MVRVARALSSRALRLPPGETPLTKVPEPVYTRRVRPSQ